MGRLVDGGGSNRDTGLSDDGMSAKPVCVGFGFLDVIFVHSGHGMEGRVDWKCFWCRRGGWGAF